MKFELKERFFCRKNSVCMESCSACESNGECTICASFGEPDVCGWCERNYSAEQLPLLRTMCDATNRCAELLHPYEIVDYNDIPADVQAQADTAMDEFNAAYKQLEKLMGVKMK